MKKIFFEVYTKQAIHEPITGLVLLDRETGLKKAKGSARAWGGVVVKVWARVTRTKPLEREILKAEIVFVHRPVRKANDERDKMTRKILMGKIARAVGDQKRRR